MSTGLGLRTQGLTLSFYIDEVITKGSAISILNTNALSVGDEERITCAKYDAGNTKFAGAALNDAGVGDVVTVMMVGCCPCRTGVDIGNLEKVQADPADASFLDFAAGIEHGIALENGSATALTVVLVNGIGYHGFGGT